MLLSGVFDELMANIETSERVLIFNSFFLLRSPLLLAMGLKNVKKIYVNRKLAKISFTLKPYLRNQNYQWHKLTYHCQDIALTI